MASESDVGAPLMLTYKQACVKGGISMTKLYQLMREGEIIPLKLGPRTRRIAPEDIQAYVDRLKAESGEKDEAA